MQPGVYKDIEIVVKHAASIHCQIKRSKARAVHKMRHAIFCQFLPVPVTLCHTSRDPTPKVRHTSRSPLPIFSGPSTKKPGQKPLVQILSQFAGAFV